MSQVTTSQIDSIRYQKGLDGEARAICTLEWIARLVTPIMQDHGWRLQLLEEMHPDEHTNWLGYNAGQKEIHLRLRQPGEPVVFCHTVHVISVMLHELAHMVHWEHTLDFYDFHEQLFCELEAAIKAKRVAFPEKDKLPAWWVGPAPTLPLPRGVDPRDNTSKFVAFARLLKL
ncbi:hypothetical protein VTJ49DRAFT_1828 [Mycothermus thermophilus]|uniref:WLM domain-containing protein n=1 Tax=Humicola insolens TaxID=85995 RepID=A0ABR3VCA0_HUMIN